MRSFFAACLGSIVELIEGHVTQVEREGGRVQVSEEMLSCYVKLTTTRTSSSLVASVSRNTCRKSWRFLLDCEKWRCVDLIHHGLP